MLEQLNVAHSDFSCIKISNIVENLGNEYFGISRNEWRLEIEFYKISEKNKEVICPNYDKKNRPYLIFRRANNKTSRYYLK